MSQPHANSRRLNREIGNGVHRTMDYGREGQTLQNGSAVKNNNLNRTDPKFYNSNNLGGFTPQSSKRSSLHDKRSHPVSNYNSPLSSKNSSHRSSMNSAEIEYMIDQESFRNLTNKKIVIALIKWSIFVLLAYESYQTTIKTFLNPLEEI